MYFRAKYISKAIEDLKYVHPFYGITFLACKHAKLPVGKSVEFAMDSKTKKFLSEFHRLDPRSNFFFQPYGPKKRWVKHDYAASGLQAINTQTFLAAFIHESNTRIWGWRDDYIAFLASKLGKDRKIPALALAVWLFKYEKWDEKTSVKNVQEKFIHEYGITDEEKALFNMDISDELRFDDVFHVEPVSWNDLRIFVPPSPDAEPDQGGTLAFLEISGLGPAENLSIEPASRLSLITGDNGLGKTFLLDCAWWALTGTWAERPAFPRPSVNRKKTAISFAIEGENHHVSRKSIAFDYNTLLWPEPKIRPTIAGLTVYARVDGSFAIWDPAKQAKGRPPSLGVFTRTQVWDGMEGRIEGLIRDWVRWQNNPSKYPFETFSRVLDRLSPPDLGRLRPGESVRIPNDPRDIPTIIHPYGITPIVYSSAGVKRIITLAYLIVWAWHEHVVAAELSRTRPQRRMVVLIDEFEAHLHPRWQREVLPALMSVGEMLSESLETQFLIATHSPLVMASAEPIFDETIDSLFHLDIDERGLVTIENIDFKKFGDISSWLTSPLFELKHARNIEAEKAIESAKILQESSQVSGEQVREISEQLVRYLGPDDKFWPRWISYAEKHGVIL